MNSYDFKRRTVLLGGAAVGLSGLLPTSISSAADDTPVRGGRLSTIANPEPPHLNPALNPIASTFLIAGKVFQSLLDYGFDLKPIPRLAESWTLSPDGKTYTFTLRKDVKWHDGKPFTSKDVVFTTTEFLPKYHPRAKGILARCESIKAPDDYTVVFTLKSPFAAFLTAFDSTTQPIVPLHIYEGTDFTKNPANAAPIGTGPFKFKEWSRGRYVHLVRNENYWRPGRPYLDEIFFSVIPDSATRATAFESGQVDMTSSNDLEYIDIKRLSALPNVVADQRGWELFAPHGMIEMNVRRKPLDDVRFRQAVVYAIDRNFIKNQIFYGFGEIPSGAIGRRTRFYDGNVRIYSFDPDKAVALLDEMGLKRDGRGERVRLKLMKMPFGDTWTRTAEYVKQALQKVGIIVDLESPDVAGWVQGMANWEFDIAFNFPYQFGDPALGVARTYITSNISKGVAFTNTIGYSNPKVDDLFEKAAAETNEGRRQTHYSEVQKILSDEVPADWLIEITLPTLYRKKFRNLVTTAIGYAADFDNVWIEK